MEESFEDTESQASASEAQNTPDSIDSQDKDQRDEHLQYLLAFLNRRLPSSPKSPSLLGEVAWAEPKEAPSNTWYLSSDESVLPHRTDFSNIRPLTEKEIKESYIVVGGELVSAVLNFDQVTVWQPMVQQISDDFRFDGHHGGYVGDQQPALHVHFGIQDGDLDLATTQNLIVLYGLFEREIERWFPVSRRNNIWCLSVRFGMEANADCQGPDMITMKPLSTTGRRYTPNQFVSSVYATQTLEDLKTAVVGYPDPMRNGIRSRARDYLAVNISPQRSNKPTTIEFRQHHGTVDGNEIKWWVMFCGYLLRYAHLLGQSGHTITDIDEPVDKPNSAPPFSYVENLARRKSILDLISFPEEGKKHFIDQAEKYQDEEFEEDRAYDDRLIEERIRRVLEGEETGEDMDQDIVIDLM